MPDDLLERLMIPKSSIVVDVGFGEFQELRDLSNIVGEAGQVIGVERSKNIAKNIPVEPETNKNVRILSGQACRIPVPDGAADVVLFKGVLHEVQDIIGALREAKRVCRNGGKIMIIDFSEFPNIWLRQSNLKWRVRHPWTLLRSPLDQHPGFSKEEILSILQKTDLRGDVYQDNFAQGRFYRYPVPMFFTSTTINK
jgi:ubiquinone/menaquinone biosynthesis C-methylase UbiE